MKVGMGALPQESTRSCSTVLQASDGESWGTGSPPTATDRVGASELKTVLLGHGASGGTCQSQSHVAPLVLMGVLILRRLRRGAPGVPF